LDDLEAGFALLESNVESGATPTTWTTLVEPLERLNDPLSRTWGVVNHLKGVCDSATLRTAHAAIQPRVVEISQKMSSSKAMYKGFKALRDGPDWDSFSEWQQRAIEGAVKDADLSGVGLEGKGREPQSNILHVIAFVSLLRVRGCLESYSKCVVDIHLAMSAMCSRHTLKCSLL
jgi:oligopeptidase A